MLVNFPGKPTVGVDEDEGRICITTTDGQLSYQGKEITCLVSRLFLQLAAWFNLCTVLNVNGHCYQIFSITKDPEEIEMFEPPSPSGP